jgi:acetyl esterase/lipase
MRIIVIFFICLIIPNKLWAQKKAAPEIIVYKTVDTTKLKITIFKPEKQDTSHAALVLIHGGGWNNGKPEAMYRHAKHFANRGLVVFTPGYRVRMRNKTTIVEAVEDALDAVAWVRAHAKEYNFDPDKIIVGGGSAGGHLAAETVFNKTVKCGASPEQFKANCLILFNPVLDVSKKGYGHKKVVEEAKSYGIQWKSLSPIGNIDSSWPPTMVMVGDKDKVLPKDIALKFERRMKKAKNDFSLKLYPDGEHTFFNFGYAKKKGYPKGTPNKYYYEVLQDVDDFLVNEGYIKEHIKVEIPENAVYPIQK